MERIVDVTIIQVGDSLGVVIPKETCLALKLKKGDSLKIIIERNK